MFKSISLLLAVIFVQGVLSQVVLKAQCPKVTVVKNFNATKFSGIWYGAYKYSFVFTNDLSCNYAKYVLTSANKTLTNGGVRKSDNKSVVLSSWPVKIVSSGKLSVGYPGFESMTKVNFYVLGTDYSKYAATYDCQQLNTTHCSVNAWLLTRQRAAAPSDIDTAMKIYKAQHVDSQYFGKNNQTNCPKVA